LDNGNGLVNGIKTGITRSAGGCLSTSYRIIRSEYQSIFDKPIHDHYFIVVLGCKDMKHRFIDTSRIIK